MHQPSFYSQRFQRFIKDIVFKREDISKSTISLDNGAAICEKIVMTELMASIQLGIFRSVSQVIHHSCVSHGPLQCKDRNIMVKDFEVIETISYPKNGSEITPEHNYRDFQFQAYAPFAFDKFPIEIDP